MKVFTKLWVMSLLSMLGVSNLYADEKIALTADMFCSWDGYGADASSTGTATVDFNIGNDATINAGGMVCGTSTVDYLIYADLTGSSKLLIEGTPGMTLRVLMNRQESNSGPLVEKQPTIGDDGKAELDLSDLPYVHINAIKTNWGSAEGKIASIKFVKPADPLAIPKETLTKAISLAKMQSPVAKTEDSFKALQEAIEAAQKALVAEDATAESLEAATKALNDAIAALELAEGYENLTKDNFFTYAAQGDETGTANAGCAYELFVASGLPYGLSTVDWLSYANLSAYEKLYVTVAAGTPRFCINRLTADGQDADAEADSKMIDIPNKSWGTDAYQTKEGDNVYIIDLAKLVADKGFAYLHCIKGANWNNVTVTGMYLYKTPEPEGPVIEDGAYFVKNVGNGKYLASANSWGTQASVADAGSLFNVKALSEGGYSFESPIVTVANKFLGSNLYTDSTTPEGGFTIEKNEDGTFVIKLAGNYLAASTEVGSTNDPILVTTEELTDAAKWQFLTKEQAIAALAEATAEAPISATFLISNPSFNRNVSTANWTVSADCGNKNLSGGADNNRCAESWHSSFTISQVLSDAPAGKYKLVAQGFYRQDDGAEEAAPVFFANDKTVAVPVKTGDENSMADASASFTNNLYFSEAVEVTVASDGALTIGVKNNGNTHQWVIWDNFQLTYLGNQIDLSEFVDSYNKALADAKAALANADYEIVTGEERDALTKAIADNETVEQTQEALTAAIAALTTATNTFTAAKAGYQTLANAKTTYAELSFPYAAAEKKEAAEATLTATATSATDAQTKTAAILKAFRQYAESNALLEGVEGAVNKTDLIVNPTAEEAIAEPWATILGEGSGGSLNILNSEPWVDGQDNAVHKYFDGGNWNANAWDVALQQEIALPAGKYLLSAKMRASADVEQTLFAGEAVQKSQSIGASGGLFDRGWNDTSVEFELTENATINIGVRGVTTVLHNWMSFSDFRLVQFPAEPEPVPDGIRAINADQQQGTIYNLNGQKVLKTQKGLFIVNGKKLLVK